MEINSGFFSVTIWVTQVCNMRCTYCYEGSEKKHVSMSMQTAIQIVNWIEHYMDDNEYKYLLVRFHGGEPTLNIEIIEYIVNALNHTLEYKPYFEITSNGYGLSENTINYLCANIHEISISIDGNKKWHDKNRKDLNGKGTFDSVMISADKILRKKRDVIIRITVTPENVDLLYDNLKNLKTKGYRKFNIGPDIYSEKWNVYNLDNMVEQCCKIRQDLHDEFCDISLPISEKVVKLPSCGGGYNSFNILPDGRIYPCIIAIEEKQCIGNVFEGIERNKLKEIRALIERPLQTCETCKGYESCICVRCKFMNKKITGDYLKPVALFCELHRRSAWG